MLVRLFVVCIDFSAFNFEMRLINRSSQHQYLAITSLQSLMRRALSAKECVSLNEIITIIRSITGKPLNKMNSFSASPICLTKFHFRKTATASELNTRPIENASRLLSKIMRYMNNIHLVYEKFIVRYFCLLVFNINTMREG